jgi:hypothetical protein
VVAKVGRRWSNVGEGSSKGSDRRDPPLSSPSSPCRAEQDPPQASCSPAPPKNRVQW